MVPAVAVHPAAPVAVNCCVLPRVTVAVAGETTIGVAVPSVAVVLVDPPAPVAVMVTLLPEVGILDGAVKRPAEVIVPADAVQLVAPVAENCCVPLRATVGVAGRTAPVGAISVTVAFVGPGAPFAVTVTVLPEEGKVVGAV